MLALQRLKEAAEKTKHELSTAVESEINIPFIAQNDGVPAHLVMKMTRAKLEELAAPFIDKSIEITKRAIAASPFKINEIDEVIMVGGQTRMPKIVEEVKKLFGKEPNRSINPDEVVALGAAVQAGVLQGDVKDVLLLDVIPLSLGIETLGGVMTKIVEKNTTIPTSKTPQPFSTASDNQTSVEIHILQGERPMAADNKSLGRFVLGDIAPAPRGMPQIEVTFDIDANGILKVKAVDKATNKEASITVQSGGGLSDADIKKMQEDAEKYKAEDEKKKELVDKRNTADTSIFAAEKSLKEYGDKIPADTKTAIEDKIKALNEVKGKDDADAIHKATEELSNEMMKIYEVIQKAEQEKAAQAGASSESTDQSSSENTQA